MKNNQLCVVRLISGLQLFREYGSMGSTPQDLFTIQTASTFYISLQKILDSNRTTTNDCAWEAVFSQHNR